MPVRATPQDRPAMDEVAPVGWPTGSSLATQGKIETNRESVPQEGAEFIGIPEWCRRVGCSRESGYRAARRDEIPGLFRIGRLKRVNWLAFVSAAGQSKVSGTA